jgi:3-methyladenine DNA glycosylase AlkC
LCAVLHAIADNFAVSYIYQEKVQMQLQELFANHDAWLIPAIHTTTNTTRLIAIRADRQAAQYGQNRVDDDESANGDKTLQSAAMVLQKAFKLCLTDREKDITRSRKRGVLYIVNQLCSIYFRLNMTHLCENLTKQIEPPSTRPGAVPRTSLLPQSVFEQLPKRDQVTYKYYTGRIALMKDQYQKAERDLDYACAHCHRKSHRNKRLILVLLVPLKLCLGKKPSDHLLRKYQLNEYTALARACCHGDLVTYNQCVAQYMPVYIGCRVYLLIIQLKQIIYRNLLRTIVVTDEGKIPKQAKVVLKKFQLALQLAHEDADEDVAECILATLIDGNRVRGYYSHSHKTLVLSSKDPFPQQYAAGTT